MARGARQAGLHLHVSSKAGVPPGPDRALRAVEVLTSRSLCSTLRGVVNPAGPGPLPSEGEQMVMIESLLDEVQATNDRLGRSMDEFRDKLTAFRDWARTVSPAEPPTPSGASTDEWPLRAGTTSRGPV